MSDSMSTIEEAYLRLRRDGATHAEAITDNHFESLLDVAYGIGNDDDRGEVCLWLKRKYSTAFAAHAEPPTPNATLAAPAAGMPKYRLNNRQDLTSLRQRIEQYLEVMSKEMGIVFKLGGCGYNMDGLYCHWKLEAAVVGEGGVAESKERAAFKLMARRYGLAPDDQDKTFQHGRDTYRVDGINTRKRNNPILCIQVRTGKTYCFPGNAVKAMLQANSAK